MGEMRRFRTFPPSPGNGEVRPKAVARAAPRFRALLPIRAIATDPRKRFSRVGSVIRHCSLDRQVELHVSPASATPLFGFNLDAWEEAIKTETAKGCRSR